jgi:hypothetical protein
MSRWLPMPKGHQPLVRFLQGLGLDKIEIERERDIGRRSSCERLASGCLVRHGRSLRPTEPSSQRQDRDCLKLTDRSLPRQAVQ